MGWMRALQFLLDLCDFFVCKRFWLLFHIIQPFLVMILLYHIISILLSVNVLDWYDLRGRHRAKAEAVYGALRGEIIDTLLITSSLAVKLLEIAVNRRL